MIQLKSIAKYEYLNKSSLKVLTLFLKSQKHRCNNDRFWRIRLPGGVLVRIESKYKM